MGQHRMPPESCQRRPTRATSFQAHCPRGSPEEKQAQRNHQLYLFWHMHATYIRIIAYRYYIGGIETYIVGWWWPGYLARRGRPVRSPTAFGLAAQLKAVVHPFGSGRDQIP